MTGKKSAVDATTREYQIYKFSSDDYIQGVPAVIVCKNDTEALAAAKKLLDGLDIEVWEGERKLVRIKSLDAK
jgi:hypothetical protein